MKSGGQNVITISREQALAQGLECYSRLHRACVETDGGWFSFGGCKIYWTEVLQRFLTLDFADALQQSPRWLFPPIKNKQRLYFWKQKMLWLYEGLKQQKKTESTDEILFAPKQDNHLRDMLPVSRILKERYSVRAKWLMLNPPQAKDVPENDRLIFPCVVNYKEWREEQRKMVDALGQVVRRLQQETPPSFLNQCEWSKLLEQTFINIRLQAGYVAMIACLIRAALENSKPKIILIGNPYVSEGRLLLAASKGYGAASAFMQHGKIDASDALQSALPVDRAFVWNTQSRDALLCRGYKKEQVFVTGAAWLDDFAATEKKKEKSGKPIVLVALSGAGHSIGLDEHKKIVEKIYLAAKDLPDARFVFRLHPKDDVKIYKETALHTSVKNCRIVKADEIRNIFDQLAEADALITVGSTSAIDAMLCNVPVVTLERENGADDSHYVLSGATNHIKLSESLAQKLNESLLKGEPEDISTKAKNYVTEFYGARDKKAAIRIADNLAALAVLSPK